MYYYEDSAEKALVSEGYEKLTRKPWNVRPSDVILLHHWGYGPIKPEHWIPVEVTTTFGYPEYHRTDVIPNRYTKVSRTSYKLSHRALHPTVDDKNLIGWWDTVWYSTDTVEIWRKKPTNPNTDTKK